MRGFAVIFGLALAAPASAQELVFSPDATEACLSAAGAAGGPLLQCAGMSADACIEDTEGGYSTVGMGACTWAEYEYWDARLNAVYGRLMAQHEADDAEYDGTTYAPPSMAEALREMQRVWIPFRDAKCAHERSQWGGGTGGGPAEAACLLTTTAEQTLHLESYLRGAE
ncbi:DUF1311 domain-containing protein [Rhodobacterales bacterium HKCCE3408]|nr:DUF1311 domain-containing protein [Rhodobacterales bacterium HKCCE3408]